MPSFPFEASTGTNASDNYVVDFIADQGDLL